MIKQEKQQIDTSLQQSLIKEDNETLRKASITIISFTPINSLIAEYKTVSGDTFKDFIGLYKIGDERDHLF